MKPIESSLSDFTQALRQGKAVNCTSSGKWYIEGRFMRFVRWLLGLNCRRINTVVKVFNKFLDNLEKTDLDNQVKKLKYVFRASNALFKKLNIYRHSRSSKITLSLLKIRKIALKYRVLSPRKLQNSMIDESKLHKLELIAENWKERQKFYPNTPLSECEKDKLKQVFKYPRFARLLLEDSIIQSAFFSWALKTNNKVDIFVEFPGITSMIKTAHLSPRIGRFGGEDSKITSDKKVTLLFEVLQNDAIVSKPISIMDDSLELTFRHGCKATIRQIFNCFKNKNNKPGHFEYFPNIGITNWAPLELGYFDGKKVRAVDLNSTRWYEDFPVLKTYTLDEVKKRYYIPDLKPNQWVALAQSTRQAKKMDVNNSHGFLGILLPKSDGRYQLFEFGKFAKSFPHSKNKFIEKLKLMRFVTNTVESRIEYPDENGYYGHRQKACVPFLIDRYEGLDLMEIVRKELIKAKSGNMIFQFAYENCAYWPQTVIETLKGKDKVPNLFKLHIFETQTPLLSSVFRLVRKLPKCMHQKTLRIVEYLIGCSRGMTVIENGKKMFKCTTESDLNKKGYFAYVPAFLHRQIEEKKIQGTITYGHC